MIKMAIYLAGFFIVYRLLLSRDTLYNRNRVYILCSLIASLILPLITIQTTRQLNLPVFGRVLSEIFNLVDAYHQLLDLSIAYFGDI